LRTNRAWAIGASIRLIAADQAKFTDRVIDIYRENASSPGAATAMINYYRGAVQRPGGAPGLSRDPCPNISTPTLMIWGEQDTALGIEMTEGTDRYVDDFTLRTLPGVSHWVQQEAPEIVNTMMKAWLTGHDVPQATDLAP
jgi:pimeloyl-ACP methyl ester carboxylesterase